MTAYLHYLHQNLVLLYLPVGAAVVGFLIGRLLRGPRNRSKPPG